eukprot:TRINITY_DN7217_c0_g1_i1.p1 TRINITY_DN7217_c0_g1~~TRINITY_DN7217_c0_g1_i1.p1  ORF type:complete len:215 (+),score=34.68 TRINITY_DN7217_c0_g1_i1:614-1258(+)
MRVQREINPFIAKVERKEPKDQSGKQWRVVIVVLILVIVLGGVVVWKSPDSEKPPEKRTSEINPLLLVLPESADRVAVHVNGYSAEPHGEKDPGLALVILHPAPLITKRGQGVTSLSVFLEDVPPGFTSEQAVHTNLLSILKVLPTTVQLVRICIHEAVIPPHPSLIPSLLKMQLTTIVTSRKIHPSWDIALRSHNLSMASQNDEQTTWSILRP